MATSVSVFIGLRYLQQRRRSRSVSFISAIAMAGIFLGVGLLITVLSVMNGFDQELRERILSIMPQVTVYHRNGVENWQAEREQLLLEPSVLGVAPYIELQTLANVGKTTKPLFIYGVDADLEPTVSQIEQFLAQDTLTKLEDVVNSIALGADLAATLQLSIGDTLTLIAPSLSGGGSRAPAVIRATLIDVFKTGTELDNSFGLMSLTSAAQLVPNLSGVTGFHLRITALFEARQVSSSLESRLPPGYSTRNWTQTHGNIYLAIQMSKKLVGLMLFLIIAIAAFNIVSTMVMVVVDKQTDIAILQTLGLSRAGVMKIFIVQGVVIGVLGTLAGVLLGLVLSYFVSDWVLWLEQLFNIRFLQSDVYPVNFLPSTIHTSDVVQVSLISLLMCFLSTLYPAWKASTVNPAKALRYDE